MPPKARAPFLPGSGGANDAGPGGTLRVRPDRRLEVSLGEGLAVLLWPEAPLAQLARRSRHSFLRGLHEQIEAALALADPFDEWIGLALDCSDAKARADGDELFAAYVGHCISAGVRREDRLSFARFGAALARRGFASVKDRSGRTMRAGCRLRRSRPAATPFRAEPGIDDFLAQACCAYGRGSGWTRANVLHTAYAAWAEQAGAPALSSRRLSEALQGRGIERRTSNGRRYQVELHGAKGPDLFTPGPPDGVEPGNSDVDQDIITNVKIGG